MKMVIPKQDKVKRLLLLQLDAQVSEEEQKRIQVTLSKQKNQELGMIYIMQPLKSVQIPIIKYKEFLCSLLTALPNQYLMLHRHWRINNLRIQRAKNYFCNVLHPLGTETYVFLLGNWEGIAMKPIYLLYWQQFNILRLFFKAKMMKSLTMKAKMRKMTFHAFRTLQRPPASQKNFLERFLFVQLSTGRFKCAMILGFVFVHVQSIPVHGGITRTSLFIMIMDARQLP